MRKSFEKFEQTLQRSKRLREAAIDALDKKNIAESARKGTEVGTILLDLIIKEQAIPGIPSNNRPEKGLFGDLVSGFVWHTNERELCLQDNILAKLIGQNKVGEFNRAATMRDGIKCFTKDKNFMVLSPDAVLELEQQPRGKVYPLESAYKILERTGVGFPEDLTFKEMWEHVNAAAKWWREHCDTNLARVDVRRTQETITSLDGQIKTISDDIEGNKKEKSEKEQLILNVKKSEYAWQEMKDSNLFKELELASPAETGDVVQKSFDTAQTRLDEHRYKATRFEPLVLSYNECLTLYPDVLPDEALKSLELSRNDLKDSLADSEAKLNASVSDKNRIKGIKEQKERSLYALVQKNDRFEACLQGNLLYSEIFGDVDPKGLDKTVQNELVSIRTAIAMASAREKELIPLVNLIKEFINKYPELDCNDVIANTKDALLNIQRQIDEKEKQLNDTQLRLSDLRQHKIAPTAIARRALDLVGPPKTVHETVCEFDITSARKAQVLSSLSAILFAPVFSDPADAGKAIDLLERDKIPIPVFVEAELIKYAGKQDIFSAGDVYYSHQAGKQNLTVSTIIDPDKIHALIDEASRELTAIENVLNKKLRNEKVVMDRDLLWLNDVKRALDGQSKGELEKAERTLSELQQKLPEKERRASGEAIDAIRNRQTYLSLGGDIGQSALSEEISSARGEFEKVSDELKNAEQVYQTSNEAYNAYQSRHHEFEKGYFQKKKLIEDSIRFVKEGGPEFMPLAKETEMSLKNEVIDARKRLSFSFKVAQQYIDSRDSFHTVVHELDILKKRINKLELEKEEAEKNKTKTEKAHREAWERTARLDEGVAHLLGQWKDWHATIRQITKDKTIHDLDHMRKLVMGKQNDYQFIIEAMDQISASVAKPSGAESIRQSFAMIKDHLGSIEKKRDEVKRKQDFAEKAHNKYEEERERYLEENAGGLSHSEKETIATAGDDYNEVLSLFNKLDASFNALKAEVDELQRGIDAVVDRADERLSNLVQDVGENLDILKKVARRSADGTIIVETSMIEGEALRRLIREILDKVEERVLSADLGKKSKKESKKLKEEVAELFYKGVFPTAKVLIKHASVRGGKPTPFLKKDISSGEKLAITLVIIGKLQEFIQEREIHWQGKSLSRKRRSRGKSQGLLLLDGIFSKLSQKNMIQVAMDAYRGLKGSFQLIGLNHYTVENDNGVFPNYFEVRKVSTTTGGFLLLDDQYKPVRPEDVGRREGELIAARTTIVPFSKNEIVS